MGTYRVTAESYSVYGKSRVWKKGEVIHREEGDSGVNKHYAQCEPNKSKPNLVGLRRKPLSYSVYKPK